MSELQAPALLSHVSVAVPVPLRKAFTYSVPAALQASVRPGSRVAVPFGPRKLPAVVLGPAPEPPAGTRIRPIAGVIDPEPVFGPELLLFLERAADYYLHPIGEVLRAALPAMPAEAIGALRSGGFLQQGETLPGARIATRNVLCVRRGPASAEGVRLGKSQQALLTLLDERGEIMLDELRRHLKSPRTVVRALEGRQLATTHSLEVPADRFFADAQESSPVPELNAAQATAVQALVGRLEMGGAFLLRGVTGSGKTEVYLRLIAEARARGQGALVLVPEIALTPQLVARFRGRFGDEIAVLHSELSERERNDAWRGLRQGRVRLAIGARSALFAPVERLGVLVVDEEHDGSFKQEDGFRYHARDMAILRAHLAHAVCVLGSATPSLESHELARRGKLSLLELPERATAHSLPPVEIVDLSRHRKGPSGLRYLSAPLHRALEECLARGEQAILFLNRRGFSPNVRCDGCGEILSCPSCSVGLTVHRRAGVLRCHYCDYSVAWSGEGKCTSCGSTELLELGLGTEQVEQQLAQVFPAARVARLDRDTASGEGVQAVLDKLRKGAVDILVGTQMVTKGHDVPNVTVVGVILADQSLAFPDLRAAERTFQLLSQVAGRAGRGERPGRVILQTYLPDHHALRAAQKHDYLGFVRAELPSRREHGFPPYGRLVAVRVDSADEQQARAVAEELGRIAHAHPAVRADTVSVLGPAEAPIARLRGRYRQRLLLQASDRNALRAVAAALLERIEQGLGAARASVDVDPVSML